MEEGCTVVLPTYNEEGNIGKMVSTLREMYPDFHVLVMDDNSKDGTKGIVDAIAERDDHVRFFTRDPDDRGLSASIFEGIMESKTRYFINMDSDFQHPPSALQGMYDLLCNGGQLVIGVRRDRSNLDGIARWIGSWGAHYLAAFTLRLHDKQISSDIMSGLFGGDTEMCQQVITKNRDQLEMKGYKALFDLMKFVPKDVDLREYEYDFGEREEGESKISAVIPISLLKQCDGWGRFLSRILETRPFKALLKKVLKN